jgi:hypothetical protein
MMKANVTALLWVAALASASWAADVPYVPESITVAGDPCAINGTLQLNIKNLTKWMEATKKDAAKLVLYLDGVPMRGLKPRVDRPQNDVSVIRFYLDRDPSNEDNRKAWDTLLSRTHGGMTRTVQVGVGFEGELPYPAENSIKLQVMGSTSTWIFLLFVVVAGIIFVALARTKNLLRDGGPNGSAGERPFSLAKTQMAFWAILVFAAFVFVWMATGRYEPLSAQVLGLMGISAATGLFGVAINNAKREQAKTAIAKLQAEEASLQEAKATSSVFPSASQARLSEIEQSIDELTKETTTPPSDGFLNDLLTDANGLSFHRLQIVVWTLLLGVTFCFSVYNVLSMPSFPDSLLILMGISNGTYLGFKFPEKQA